MRIALIVGINYYEHGDSLFGCVDDAHAVQAVLERHGNGSVNFAPSWFPGIHHRHEESREIQRGRSEVNRLDRPAN